MLLLLISVRGWVDPRAIVRSEGFYINEKLEWHQLGIEPATFQFVEQHLNHYATVRIEVLYNIPFESGIPMKLVRHIAVPLQFWSGPEGSRKFRLPDVMTTAQDVGKVVSLTHRLPLPPQEMLLLLISVRGWVDPRAIVRLEGFYVNEKLQWHQLGIEPETFRFVAQHLNHCATAGPQ